MLLSATETKSHIRKFRLRTILVVPIITPIFVMTALVGYLSFRTSKQSINDIASQLRTEIATRVKEEINQYLSEPQLLHEINKKIFEQNLIDLENHDAIEYYFWQQSRLFKNLGTIAYANNQGEFIGANGLENYVVSATQETGSTLRRYAVDNEGKRGKLLRERPNYDATTRSWYKTAVAAGKPTWAKIEPSAIGQRLDASAVYPIYDPDRNLQGVLLCDLPLSGISDFLQTLKIGKTGEAFIIEKDGLVVADSTTKTPFIPGINGDEPKRMSAKESPNPILRATVETLTNRFINLNKIDQTQQLEFLIKQQKLFLQVVPFQDGKGIDWLILIVVSESDFLDKINANINRTILLCLILLAISSTIGIMITRTIAKPILRLTKASELMAQGNLEQHVKELNRIVEIETLSHSFNTMAGQLTESFHLLEDKVKQRTKKLAEANQKISALNAKLTAENLRMSTELDIARQIQLMILPKLEELKIPGVNITGFMKPADEVGGDYYDVLFIDDILTLVIGDVTGHGLESGILMLMTQMAIRTLKESGEKDPIKLLNTINRSIYKNIERMDSDKNLTLVVLNYYQGTLNISGQHEQVIIIRNNREIELIDTIDLGFPIGLEPEISDFIQQKSIDLEPGDGIVLYTDGIPEAENINQVQYGMEKLCEIIRENWTKSTEEINQAVIDDLQNHIGTQKIYDDITLLVLKRQDTAIFNS